MTPTLHDHLGIAIPHLLLPKIGTNLTTWSVVACDQFTSQPEYWKSVENLVGKNPSTLQLIFPEVYLGKGEDGIRIAHIHQHMHQYLQSNLFAEHAGTILVERQSKHHKQFHTRHGIMLALDLEQYEYTKGSTSLIRATEGTIIERLPPRIRIREGAPLEAPHIMVLIDDPAKTVIEPLQQSKDLRIVYDFDLMMDSGHLKGFAVPDDALATAIQALEKLADPISFAKHYQLNHKTGVLLFAVGDGNHSLATAKAIWTKLKEQAPDKTVISTHPARYALVEVVNVHDPGLVFEPIHRVLFEIKEDLVKALGAEFGNDVHIESCTNMTEMMQRVDQPAGKDQIVGIVTSKGYSVVYFTNTKANLAVGTLQTFLDNFVRRGGCKEIDYVHGSDVVKELGERVGNAGFYLPAMDKRELFRTVILDGALPRKTFSMGEANEKRFYCEARRILP